MNYWELAIDFVMPLILAVLGGYLFWRGLWPKVRAWEQRCYGCGYDMRATKEMKCPECGRVAADVTELLGGVVSRKKAGCGVVLMVPMAVVLVLMAVLLPGPWLAEREWEAVSREMKGEMEGAGGTVEMVSRLENRPAAELTGWRRWCFYWMRLMIAPTPAQLSSSVWMSSPPDHWALAGGDNVAGPEFYGYANVSPLEFDLFSWTWFVMHQWLCPVVHYGWYRVDVPRVEEVTISGKKERAKEVVAAGVCRAMEKMPAISRVVLRDIMMDDALAYAMVSRKNLTELEMDGCDVGDSQFELLGTWGKIEELTVVAGREVRPEIWASLGRWRKLKGVTVVLPRFQIVRVEGKAFAELLKSKTIVRLKVQGRLELDDARPVVQALKASTVKLEPGCVFVLRGDEGSGVAAALRRAGAVIEVMESGGVE